VEREERVAVLRDARQAAAQAVAIGAVEGDQRRQTETTGIGQPLREDIAAVGVFVGARQHVPRHVEADLGDAERKKARIAEEREILIADADQWVRRRRRGPRGGGIANSVQPTSSATESLRSGAVQTIPIEM